tara:strand:- start:1004 stop:1984 length:981 start_codon:yes stop_codon:yes gene_type:complete
MNYKKVIVTGGSGFIGTNFIEKLRDNEIEILNIDKNPPRNKAHNRYWKNINILDKKTLINTFNNFKPDMLLHLAARTDLDGKTIDDYEVNTVGVSNIIEAINYCGTINISIFASSMLVCRVGYVPKGYDDYCPPNAYGLSKVEGEKLVNFSLIKSKWFIIRPTSIWGPWFDTYKNFFQLIRKGFYFNISNKKTIKTYGFVYNLIFQIFKLVENIERSHNKTFYIGDYDHITISEWANIIGEKYNRKVKSLPYFVMKTVAMIGDLFKGVNLKFPMTSFRLNNMITENRFQMKDTKKLTGNYLPYNIEESVDITIKWIEEDHLNNFEN